jgi:hypothetical protein
MTSRRVVQRMSPSSESRMQNRERGHNGVGRHRFAPTGVKLNAIIESIRDLDEEHNTSTES